MIMVLSVLLLILCIRSVIKSSLLFFQTVDFFSKHYKDSSDTRLDFNSMFQFIDIWFIAVVVESVLLFWGSFSLFSHPKFNYGEQKIFYNAEADTNGTVTRLLAFGNFFFWCSLIRYLFYYPKYTLLFSTLKHVCPRLARFAVGVIILFAAFCCSCWLFLHLVHSKFDTFSKTSQALFGLMNGDEVFGTLDSFSGVDGSNLAISRFVIVIFVLLFIFVVLSVFIAIITETYEEVKGYYSIEFENCTKNDFQKRIRRGTLPFSNNHLAQFVSGRCEIESEAEIQERLSPCWYKWFREQLSTDQKNMKLQDRKICEFLTIYFSFFCSTVCYCLSLLWSDFKECALILLSNICFCKKYDEINCCPECSEEANALRKTKNDG